MPSDQEIKEQVNRLFKYYDENESGYLETDELDKLIHDLSLELKVKKQMPNDKISQISTHLNKAGMSRGTKDELFVVLKMIN